MMTIAAGVAAAALAAGPAAPAAPARAAVTASTASTSHAAVTAPAAAAGGTWGTAVEVPGTAALNTGDAGSRAISCATPGNCSVGGYYQDASGHYQAFAASQVNGTWQPAIEVPGTAALNAGGDADLTSVSCATAGNCTSAGTYNDASGHYQVFAASQVNGTWHNAIEIPGTAALNTGGYAGLNSVSCASAGNCTTAGYYYDSSGHYQAFAASQVNGTWHNAIEIPGTAALNTGGSANINSVSCTSPGNCTAAGYYYDSSQHYQAFAASQVNGTWHNAIEIPGTAALNTGGSAALNSVSCAAAGNCAAGGYYYDGAGNRQAFVTSEVNGTWQPAIEVPGTAALNAGGTAEVDSVSCTSAGNCAAGGYYTDGAGHGHAFVTNQVNGTWQQAIEIPGTAALNTGGFAGVASVSCIPAGNCAATGYYTDSSGHTQVYVVSQSTPHPTVTGQIRGYQNHCATDTGYSNKPGTSVTISPCNALLREKWTIGAHGELTIHGLCLTDPGNGLWRTKVNLQPCQGQANQQWTHRANGEYTVAVHGLCLTDPRWSTTTGTQLIIQSCRDWTNQRWTQP